MRTLIQCALTVVVVVASWAAEPAAVDVGGCLELRTYYAAQGHLGDLKSRFRDRVFPLFQQHGIHCVGFWVPRQNLDQRMVLLLAYESREARDVAWRSLVADPEWKEGVNEGGVMGRWVSRVENVYLEPTDYSPQLNVRACDPPRLFEMRTYTASRGRRTVLNQLCREATTKLYARHGIESLGFWVPMRGQQGADERLVSLVAYKDGVAASTLQQELWCDPEWLEAKRAFDARAGGPLTVQGGEEVVWLEPTEQSALR